MSNQLGAPAWPAGDPLFHEVWEASLDAKVLSDGAGIVVLANPAYYQLYAFSPEQVLGHEFAIIFPEAEREAARAGYQAVFQAGQPIESIESTVRRGDGSVRVVETRVSFIVRAGERYMLSMIRDITERKATEQQLREAQQLLEAGQRMMHLGSFEVSFKTNQTIWSDEVFRIYGLPPSPEPLDNHAFISYAHPDDRHRLLESARSFSVDPVSRPIEYRILRPDGDIRSLIAIPRLEYDQHQQPERIIGAVLDVTDLRRLEDERARLAAVLEASPDPVGIADPAGWVLYLNPAGRRLLGLDHEAPLSGLHIRDMFDPSTFPRMLTEAIPAAAAQGIWRGESLLRSYDGRLHPVSQVIIRHTDEAGAITHFSTLVRDISEFKAAQSAIAELNRSLEARVAERTAQLAETVQELLQEVSARAAVQAELQAVLRLQRTILASASYAIIATSLDGTIVSFNAAAERLLGYRADEVIGRMSLVSLHDPDELRARTEDLARILGFGLDLANGILHPVVIGEQPYEAEWTYRRADGGTLPVTVSLTTLRDEDGQPEGFLSIVADISERRAAEEALRRANADMARAARLKDEFLANMSHELRTPLNAILGRAEVLQEQVYGPLNEQQQRSVHSIEESGRDLLSLINDILDIAKIEAGRIELQLEPCDVVALSSASMRMVSEVAQKKRIAVSLQIDGQVNRILADQRRLKQVLVNLLSNAVKFTPAGGAIGLEVCSDPEACEVSFAVFDTGIGIDPEDQQRLFQPFVQIDSSLSRQYAGTGLGLSLVHRLTRMHGGRVELQSAPGKGSRFTVVLPWQAATLAPPHEPPADYVPPVPDELISTGALVLLVDDSYENIELLREYLEALRYRVAVVRSGLEALQVAPVIDPAVVVMDIQMPGIDGLETIRRLRAAPATARLPIIALTALAMVGDRERCLEAGANEYISKPVSLRVLAGLIARYTVASASGAVGQ